MRIGIVGSRRRDTVGDKELIKRYVISQSHIITTPENTIGYVSGGCKQGADKFIKEICEELHYNLKEFLPIFPTDKELTYSDRVKAYYSRNKQIADYVDKLVVLRAPDHKGGTENTIKYFLERKKKEPRLELIEL